jgi:hypothetical protein
VISDIDFIEFSITIGYGSEHTSKLGIEGKHLLLNQYIQVKADCASEKNKGSKLSAWNLSWELQW